MASGSSIVVPMVLWGRHAPTHCVSTILMTPDMKHVITGCNDGQICIWDVGDNWQVGICSGKCFFHFVYVCVCVCVYVYVCVHVGVNKCGYLSLCVCVV